MSYFEMSKLALKWAFTKPPTTRYPFEPRKASRRLARLAGFHRG